MLGRFVSASALLLLACCAHDVQEARAVAPARATARAAPVRRDDAAPAWRILPDGQVVPAGAAPDPFASLLPRFEAELARVRGRDGIRAAWAALLRGVDERSAGEIRRLDALRVSAACEARLHELRAIDPELAEELAPRVETSLASLGELLEAPVEEGGAYSVVGGAGPALLAPVEPLVVNSPFGPRDDPFDGRRRQHFGLDLEARAGQSVRAAAAGRVVSAGWAGGHGKRVEIDHGGGVVTGYSHLDGVLVARGARVAAGAPIGLAGATGRTTGPHLHFELWRDGEPEDPLLHLDAPRLAGGAR